MKLLKPVKFYYVRERHTEDSQVLKSYVWYWVAVRYYAVVVCKTTMVGATLPMQKDCRGRLR